MIIVRRPAAALNPAVGARQMQPNKRATLIYFSL